MTPLLTALRDVLPGRGSAVLDDCLVCHHPVRGDERFTRLPRGGYVHRDCATYSMRRQQRIRRRIGRR